ncbi:MAG: hypothetical protein OJF52_003223 [Nitrospira sp.]|jgi:hypothetical protein|nr:MAG: hypothetical protein OJF52_003223 [Nitrospira sp.]
MPKRRASRVEMSRSVEFHGPYGTSQGTVQDFSPRGCRIHRVDAKVHCGMRLTLRFSLPDRLEPTEIKHAVVTWTRKNDFGVEFSNQSRETLARVKQVYELLLDAQTPEESSRVISLPTFALR